MKVFSFFLLIGLAAVFGPQADAPPATTPSGIATELLGSLDKAGREAFHRGFDDPRRLTWDRIPKIREGLKISALTQAQKALMHRLLQQCMSREGYLLATSVMFNEDIQKKFEPDLGRNEYWVELFGNPATETYWGWQLEGHHLSLNFTFRKNNLISHTPFLVGSNPQVVDSDVDRNGFCYLYREETLAGQLVDSFDESQKKAGYSDREQPGNLYGEVHRDKLSVPEDGIPTHHLSTGQLEKVGDLVDAYAAYFPADYIRTQTRAIGPGSIFFFMGDTRYNGKHFFWLKNDHTLIECENYGNHPHHLWRTTNDYGAEVIKR